jgi:hypothetical protein
MPLYISAEKARPATPNVRTFYSDDSVCEIQGKKHTIIGAIGFHDDKHALGSVLRCKQRLNIPLLQEIKWNSQNFTPAQREQITDELLPLLGSTIGFISIVEGQDKQCGAVKLMTQLSDYCRAEEVDAYTLIFDKNIVQDVIAFDTAISVLKPGCMGWSEVDSAQNPLVQLADLFCGFQKLRIDFGSGKANAKKLVSLEFYEGEIDEFELGHYLFAGLRYSLWGKVRGTWDVSGAFMRDPFKHNLGYGVRIFSSVGRAAALQALNEVRKDSMGCIH